MIFVKALIKDLTYILSLSSSLREEKDASYESPFQLKKKKRSIMSKRDSRLEKYDESQSKKTSHKHETWVMDSMNMFGEDEIMWKQV